MSSASNCATGWVPPFDHVYRFLNACILQHALVLESLLHESPENKPWLEQHGFDVDKLVRYLRWNPAEQLRQLEHMEPSRRARYSKELHREHKRNLRRMEENLAKALPVSA